MWLVLGWTKWFIQPHMVTTKLQIVPELVAKYNFEYLQFFFVKNSTPTIALLFLYHKHKNNSPIVEVP